METKNKQGTQKQSEKPKTRSTMNMIEPFAGNLLNSPIPLELALNYCSHKCGYCFANLNQPDRQADVDAIMKSIRKMYSGESEAITSAFLREKRPVCLSNRVDPFATSNYAIATPIVELLTQLGVPVQLQTKGGIGKAKDALFSVAEMIKHSVWYVTISQTDDAIRKAIEPGATSIKDRFDMIQKLKAMGHKVVVGVNPLVKEWCDYKEMGKMLTDAGVSHVYLQRLHLNNDQIKELSEREKNAMGLEVIKQASKRKNTFEEPDTQYVFEAEKYFRDVLGLKTYISAFTGRFFFALERNKYGKDYGEKLPLRMPFAELLSYYWDAESLRHVLSHNPNFAWAVEYLLETPNKEVKYEQLLDEYGIPKVGFH